MGRTRKCGKILRRFIIRGERLIKRGYIWFSAKSILVEHKNLFFWGRATF